MTISSRTKILLGLVVVFVAGAILGCWAHSKFTERIFLKFVDNSTWSPAVLEGLDHELHLTEEQKQQARAMLDHSVVEVTKDFSQMGEELVRLHIQLQSILTPEQQAKNSASFNVFRRELQQKYQITLPAQESLKTTSAVPTRFEGAARPARE